MASKFMRRSGISVCLIAELLEWVPDLVIQVGIGTRPEETAVFKDAWPNHELIGFEAHPGVFNAVKGSYPGQLYNCAIGNRRGSVDLWTPPRHKDGSSIHKHEGMDNLTKCVTRISTLDFEIGWDRIEDKDVLLWLDCEGCELDVLEGAAKVLKRVSTVNVEMTAKPISSKWCDANQVHDFLIAAGFKRQWVHTQRTSAGQCDAIYVRHSIFNPAYCCCPCQVER